MHAIVNCDKRNMHANVKCDKRKKGLSRKVLGIFFSFIDFCIFAL